MEEMIDESNEMMVLSLPLGMSVVPNNHGGGSSTVAPSSATFAIPPSRTPVPTLGQQSSYSLTPSAYYSPTPSAISTFLTSSTSMTAPPTVDPATVSAIPSHNPSMASYGTGSGHPVGDLSSISSIPSDYPSLAPTEKGTVPLVGDLSSIPSETQSLAPGSIYDRPTSAPLEVAIFGCDGRLSLGMASDGAPVSLTVGYKVESSSNSTDIFLASLEGLLLESALLATFNACKGRALRHLQEDSTWSSEHLRHWPVDTRLVGKCTCS